MSSCIEMLPCTEKGRMTAGRVLVGCEVCLAECHAAVAGHRDGKRKGSLDQHRASCST